MALDPERRKQELPIIIEKAEKMWMRREVDITLGILIKSILMG